MITSRIDLIASVLIQHGTILLPVDTLYGIATPMSGKGVVRLKALKQRAAGRPLALAVNGLTMIYDLISMTKRQQELLERLLPGPVTCVLPGNDELAELDSRYAGSVAFRWIADPELNELIARVNQPLLLTSANLSGETVPLQLSQVDPSLLTGVDAIFRPGSIPAGVASAVVDLRTDPPAISRTTRTLEQLYHG